MKWYKKQLDKLKKDSGDKKLSLTSDLGKKKKNTMNYPNPVKLRNKNRKKTDSIS